MSKRKHTRRDFLKGSAARERLAERIEHGVAGGPAPGEQSKEPTAGVLRITREAMGGHFEVFLNVGQYEEGTDAALEALDEVDRLEEQLSIFRATSEVSRVNQLAGDGPVAVEQGLFDLIRLAVVLHAETAGALDITSAPLTEIWGFARREGAIPTQRQINEAIARVGSDKLELDAENRTVRFLVPGMKINLGAVGKGYALDRCAAQLEARGIRDFMIHGGQSSVVARGASLDAEDRSAGWTVGVHDPTRPDRRLAEFRLVNRAVGTSGSEKQFFRYQGRRLSHVLDPRTGRPAEGGLLSATVVASQAAVADGLSTALFVMGADRAAAFREGRRDLATALVREKGGGAELISSGFEPGEFRELGREKHSTEG